MATSSLALDKTALLICDLQNDFVHAKGAYARGGQTSAAITALPERMRPLAEVMRARGGIVVATQFTLVSGRGGEPMISPHLKQMRPFLRKGDFAPGSWGNATVDALQPVDVAIEKIGYDAFYMTRLEWVLRKLGIERVIAGGIVTNGGVASTVRGAHVRDIDAIVLEDGCAAFSQEVHDTAIAALKPVARISNVAEMIAEVMAAKDRSA